MPTEEPKGNAPTPEEIEPVALAIYGVMGGVAENWMKESQLLRMEYREAAIRAIEARRDHG